VQHLKGVLAAVFAMVLVCGPIVGAAQTSPQTPAQNQQLATISGRATDSGGAPLSGVEVFIDGAVHRQATTDARGFYDLTAPPGVYLISASKTGYEQAVQDLVLTAGQKITNLSIIMAGTTLTSLRTIGTVRTSGGTRSIFNTSALSVTTMNSEAITSRVQPNLSKLVGELPGVSAGQNSGGRDPNSSWSVRGARTETKVTVDGHTVSTGTFGAYNAIFANSEIFDQVEVLKGAGINGVNAGESAFGTVNLRTRGFTGKNNAVATISGDIFSSGHYFVGIEHEFSPKFSMLAARSFNGFAGPDQGVAGPILNTAPAVNASSPVVYTGMSLIRWEQPLSHPYGTTADLVKARYNFSQSTSVTAEYLNLVGRYFSQGGSYAYDYGPQAIAQCANVTSAPGAPVVFTYIAAGAAGCTPASVYNAPQQLGLVGTTQNLYSFFPNSTINNQEPQFSLEFKTSLRNDTIFLRPYLTEIRRNIDGTTENRQPGNGGSGATAGGWYQVVDNTKCTLQFTAPVAGLGGAKGPCFSSTDGYTTPYLDPTQLNATLVPWFGYSTTAVACSPTAPCYTTPTQQQRNGLYGFGGPFSQPEFDKLGGVTFSWLHPVGENLYSLNADYSSDYTTKATADISQLPAGCNSVVGSGVPNVATLLGGAPNPYYQPNCQIGGAPFATLPGNGVSIPPTWNRKLTLSLTGLWQINPKLQVGLGNYFTFEHLTYQYTDPAQVSAAAALLYAAGKTLAGAEPSNSTLLMGSAAHVHYDPHVQAQYRLNPNASLRATAGSSITTPYASLVSGFGAFRPNTTATTDLLTLPNTALQPETTVAYDIGADIRARDGSVFSLDLFDNNIHNVFVNVSQAAAQNIRPGFTTIQSQVVNGPNELDYGVEATWQKAPRVGLGYFASATVQRAFYYGFSNNFYIGLLSAACPGTITNACYDKAAYQPIFNGKQLDGLGGYEDQIPYAKGKLELNYAFPRDRAYAAVGLVYNGNNNPYGTPSFATAYLNAKYNAGSHVTFGLAVENLLNYSNGYFNGQVINNAGFIPLGVKWNPFCGAPGVGCLANGPAQSFIYNSAVVVQPRNFYFTITDRL
jgi:outer membrane receptor protein involved in Fe transport